MWRTSLGKELKDADYGILCLTEDNLKSPWLCYEAGALGISAASHDNANHEAHVVPIRFGNVEAAQIASPIQDFQSKPFTREEMLALVLDLAEHYRSVSSNRRNLPDEGEISDKFNSSYQELADKIQAILDGAEETRIREKLNEFDEALKDFRRDNGDDEMAQMGNLLSKKLRAEGLTESGRKFADAYLELLRSNENAENAASARRLRSAISELYC